MNTELSLEGYPRVSDDKTLYNVPDETVPRAVWPLNPYGPENPPSHVVKSVADPPPLSEDEAWAVAESARRCVLDYLERHEIPTIDELNDEIFTPYDFVVQVDRTLIVVLIDPAYFPSALVSDLQSGFVRKWPLWRAGIFNDPKEDDVTIYPDVVRVGDVLCPPADLDTAIRKWQQDIREQRAPERAARQRIIRQFRYVKRRVPQLIRRLEDSGLEFVAAFEGSEYGQRRFTVVVLVDEPSRHYVATQPEDTAHSHKYSVSADGQIGVRGGHWREGPFRLLYFVLRKLENPTLTLCEGNYYGTGETRTVPDGRQWRFQITPETLITDEQLKELEANGELG